MEPQNSEELFKRELADLLNKYEADHLLGKDAEELAEIMYTPLDNLIEATCGRTN